MRPPSVLAVVLLTSLSSVSYGREKGPPFSISDLNVKGSIEREHFSFGLTFQVEVKDRDHKVGLATGDLVLEGLVTPVRDAKVTYDPDARGYSLMFRKSGRYDVEASFAARPVLVEGGPWRESSFSVPSSQMRELELVCDRTDLEVEFPNALRLTRELRDGKLTMKAVLGPGQPFTVRWKPHVQEMEAKLVVSSEANTIVTAGVGTLRQDTVFVFSISQGRMSDLAFRVPPDLNVTEVRGEHIRDWRIEGDGEERTLAVSLNLKQEAQYSLQLTSEMVLPEFPLEVALGTIEPIGGIRSAGHLAVGTNSAIHLVVQRTSALSQVDASDFPRIVLDSSRERPIPRNNTFYYSYASTPFQLGLSLDDIVPSFDSVARLVVLVGEENVVVQGALELDVRDAPVREVTLGVGGAYMVAGVSGREVEDHHVYEPMEDGAPQRVVVSFRQPVLGRTVVQLRLETGKSPLGAPVHLSQFRVDGAKSERGYLVVVAEEGTELGEPRAEGLRQVHTGSVPMKVPNAKVAYRFREKGWSLELLAAERPANVRSEAFHLISLGEGVAHGNVVVNYFISGAPVDELNFLIPETLKSVEFVSREIRRWTHEGDQWQVKLQRKVAGDFTLGISYHQRYQEGGSIEVGGVECVGPETRTGYLVVASHFDLEVKPVGEAGDAVLEVERPEIPAGYRLLVNAPILRTYKYVAAPHQLSLQIDAYDREALLPVVVEMMGLETAVSTRKDGETESVTTVRYKIKNSASQFLTLRMPTGASVWAVRAVETGREGEVKSQRIAASYDAAEGLLMIPLKRLKNPNEPMTVELEYGQAHGDLGWDGRMGLTAPKSLVSSTFSSWAVRAPKDYTVLRGTGGNLSPEERGLKPSGLSAVTRDALTCWEWSLSQASDLMTRLVCAGVALVVLLAVLLARRPALPVAVVGLFLVYAAWVGLRATDAPQFHHSFLHPEPGSSLRFAQALSLEDEGSLVLSCRVVPSWRQSVTWESSLGVPILSLLFLALAVRVRRGRRVFVSLGLAGLIFAAAQFPNAAPALGHFLTWGMPSVLCVAVLWRVGARSILALRPGLAPTTALLVCAVWLPPEANARETLPAPPPVAELVECHLRAENDSMSVSLRLRLAASRPLEIPLGLGPAILLSSERPSDYVRVRRVEEQFSVQVERKGEYDFFLEFLTPLGEPNDKQVRQYRLPLPTAVTNAVDLTIPEQGLEIVAPTAIRLAVEETESSTAARAILGPGDEAFFLWHPRARQTKLEDTVLFAEVTSVAAVGSGVVLCRHHVQLRIAQGETKSVRVRVPENMTVTSVEGADLGAWRFDPATHEVEARLARPVSSNYGLKVLTQIALESMPAAFEIQGLEVREAERQRWTMGLVSSPEVFLSVTGPAQRINVDDFTRDGRGLLSELSGSYDREVRHAFRLMQPEDAVEVEVQQVRPEIRAEEQSGFTIADDRLVYNGELKVNVAKAGVFSLRLNIPEGYDIDSLEGTRVSHWDDEREDENRSVQVHFSSKLIGSTALKLMLSQAITSLPEEVPAPRVTLEGAMKHTGLVMVSSGRSVRLSVKVRDGVSELNSLELGIRSPGVLSFKLLKPDWNLVLHAEVVEPRVIADFLHVARISDGLVEHVHHLRNRVHNAGLRELRVVLPSSAVGAAFTGPEIVKTGLVEPGSGTWQIELAGKWSAPIYPLTVRYETRFDRSAGKIELTSPRSAGTDLERGHVAVFASEKIELTVMAESEHLQRAEARRIPGGFGAGDLSRAAFCYRSSSSDYQLGIRAVRHDKVPLLEAEVIGTQIDTVVNERGETMNRVVLKMRVGTKQHLAVRLPEGAAVWSLLVNGRSGIPAKRISEDGAEEVLVPLSHVALSRHPVEVDLIYVASVSRGMLGGESSFLGPRFDLPLKGIQWRFHLPESYDYEYLESTLTPDRKLLRTKAARKYSIAAYEAEVVRAALADQRKAMALQQQGKQMALNGLQTEAKRSLESAFHYSTSDPALNEDTRVQLHQLIRQQALVGLIGQRDRVRPGAAGDPGTQGAPESPGDLVRFRPEEADRLRSSLSKADSENLELITRRVVEAQDAAAGSTVPLRFNMPLHGRLLEFRRDLQVQPNAEMKVVLDAKRCGQVPMAESAVAAGGFFVVIWLAWSVVALTGGMGSGVVPGGTVEPGAEDQRNE